MTCGRLLCSDAEKWGQLMCCHLSLDGELAVVLMELRRDSASCVCRWEGTDDLWEQNKGLTGPCALSSHLPASCPRVTMCGPVSVTQTPTPLHESLNHPATLWHLGFNN